MGMHWVMQEFGIGVAEDETPPSIRLPSLCGSLVGPSILYKTSNAESCG